MAKKQDGVCQQIQLSDNARFALQRGVARLIGFSFAFA
jgi:hypothetical protein